ncbi:s-methyl-5-thioribose-1-phosphate isomerase [Actinoalloteichus hymeniacidonis]|uniref:EIF-2B alpha/beta/delta-like protein n=1 Tax=Actinoalloteichus hymeniacidonis TaxID=340345 RepID=A0AAC9HPR8_9PSEU|nr:s-methyl-5-thioribose-1-phosphate isomerase [Actinoalloteichus hymeniacidonis]AOS63357.1 eIF-2B alpha/beta/delta-like protein [Actinoalloteichus hymeniacidonis]MBB5908603.1 methylthioribose-1-phosphate isomerase [Actinoalloteichus hymeniacidonis]
MTLSQPTDPPLGDRPRAEAEPVPPGEEPGPVLAHSVRLVDDGVLILDRRVFPFERRWAHCRTAEEVAVAIKDMVTQSSGPYFAALWAMVLAARAARGLDAAGAHATLHGAGRALVASRPTNDALGKAVALVSAEVAAARPDPRHPAAPANFPTGDALVEAAARGARAGDVEYRSRSRALGEHTAELLPDGATVLTHCWADLYLTETVAAIGRRGHTVRFVCTETRPYLQGARLTAETLAEMGVDVTLITDGMGAAVLSAGSVDALVTAADRVTMDGHVVNKVGTLGLAVAARAFDVPFYAQVQTPDLGAPGAADVPIEYRDGDEVLHTLGRRTASHRVRGHYPAFDVTPPRFVTRVVTDRGALDPGLLADYHRDGEDTSS